MTSNLWRYGDAFLRYPLEPDHQIQFGENSFLQVHDIFKPLPPFMKTADLIFVDPPWNLGNLNSFYTKADRDDHQSDFERFYNRVFACIAEISPQTCYIEVGKEYLAEFIIETKKLYKHVTFYNSSYYHKKDNFCYVIRGSNKRSKLPLDGMDEEDIIKWICANEQYSCIGDFCMGMGLVAINAFKNGKCFVGTELNHKRLSVCVERLAAVGCHQK